MEKYNVDSYVVIDDDALSKRGIAEFKNLLHLLSEHPKKYHGKIYNARIDEELKHHEWPYLFKKAGIESIQFGVESFSENVRRHMGKYSKNETLHEIIKNFSEAGIATNIYLIYGYPIETENDFLDTLDWIEKHGDCLAFVTVNMFLLNEVYAKRKPESFIWQKPVKGEPYSYWKSKEVNIRILWKRYKLIKRALNKHKNCQYLLLNPRGEYERRNASGKILIKEFFTIIKICGTFNLREIISCFVRARDRVWNNYSSRKNLISFSKIWRSGDFIINKLRIKYYRLYVLFFKAYLECYTVGFNDFYFKGDNSFDLQKKLFEINPRVNFEDKQMVLVELCAKTKYGFGIASMDIVPEKYLKQQRQVRGKPENFYCNDQNTFSKYYFFQFDFKFKKSLELKTKGNFSIRSVKIYFK